MVSVLLSAAFMSRHSKWAKIKRQKAVTDVRRGQLFTKLIRAITVAARDGGGDQETNVRLRMAVDRALAENMPRETVERAIERAAGGDGEAAMESVVIEGYGPGGAALLIEAVTDNRNRTVGEIRRIVGNAGGSLGGAGSTQWMFTRRGRLVFKNLADADSVELAAIDAGALETDSDASTVEVLTTSEQLPAVAETLTSKGCRPETSEVILAPQNPLPLPAATFAALETLVRALEDHNDVVEVTTNATSRGEQ